MLNQYHPSDRPSGSSPASLPELPEAVAPIGLEDALARFERYLILQALARTQGNKTAAAGLLNISRRALYKKLAKHAIA